MDKIFGQLIVENQEVSAQCSLDGGTLKDSCVTCPLRKKSLLNELSSDELEILNEEEYFMRINYINYLIKTIYFLY